MVLRLNLPLNTAQNALWTNRLVTTAGMWSPQGKMFYPTRTATPETAPRPKACSKLFYPTALKQQVLENLANFYALTVKDLVELIYPTPNQTHEASVRRCLSALDRDGLVNRINYRPDDYPGYGTLPLACGLTFQGLCWTHENCAWTDPKELIKDHSPLTLEHEIKRARFHTKVVGMCEQHRLELFWKKTDLTR